jgi:hypothetical protein
MDFSERMRMKESKEWREGKMRENDHSSSSTYIAHSHTALSTAQIIYPAADT